MWVVRKSCLWALLITVYFAGISALPAQAGDVPPSSTNSFYGDATGDMIIAAADIAQMNAWMLGLPYTYDTVQPQTSTQDWNTSDVTSDILIAAADISVINAWMLGFTVSVDDKPWVLSNETLPASIQVNTPTAFQINLASTLGTQFGRAGLPVIANIDAANSTATGSLAGRTCAPIVGSRDQAASVGAQCALSVTVTDWYGASGPTKGLTETGTYGFSVIGTTTGNLRIIFSISGNPPGLDIPAVSIALDIGIGMALIPSGCFNMGDAFNEGDFDERPVHNVCITSSFYMDKHEVTNAEYKACVDAGGCTAPQYSYSYTRASYYGNPTYNNFPVIFVSWYKATAYCTWAGKRLPTEAEWEYAARGGLSGKRYPWGDTISCSDANYGRYMSSSPCWNYGGLDNDTHQVGSYSVNGYGLYDMAGNVYEWVNDWYLGTYYSVSPVNDPPGPASGSYRVWRDGSWLYGTDLLLSSNRNNYLPPDVSSGSIGFRCARTP